MLPLGTSAVTIGFGFLITFDEPPLDLRGSWIIVPLAHALVATPFVVRAVLPVLRSIDPRLREAAAVLGAAPGRVWWEVDRPILARAVRRGCRLRLRRLDRRVRRHRRSSPAPATRRCPSPIVRLLGRPGAANVGQAYALAVILMVVTAAVILAVERFQGDRAGTF